MCITFHMRMHEIRVDTEKNFRPAHIFQAIHFTLELQGQLEIEYTAQ